MRRTIPLVALSCCAAVALADSEASAPLKDDIPLAAYLDGLERISPAAREAADVYLEAFRRRCGRPLKTVELRRAIADGAGDPVLMAMMLAAFQRDTPKLRRLSDAVSCARGM